MAYPYGQPAGYPFPGAHFAPPPYSSAVHPAYPARQYYFIRSRLNGLVLDIEGGSSSPGAGVILWNQKTAGNKDNQLWYDDPMTATIRSKLNDFALDIAGDRIVVNPFYGGNSNQFWEKSDAFVRNRALPYLVFDVKGANSSAGAWIVPFNQHGGVNQQFDFQFLSVPTYNPPVVQPVPPSRPQFFIVSEMNCKVLDIEGASPVSGAKVIMWNRKGGRPANQLWYFDNQGIIHSALNNFVLHASTNGSQIQMMPYSGSPHQKWTVSANRIMKNQIECLDIAGESRNDGAKVISFQYKGSANQHWRFEYV